MAISPSREGIYNFEIRKNVPKVRHSAFKRIEINLRDGARALFPITAIISCFLLCAKFKAVVQAYASSSGTLFIISFRDRIPIDDIPPVRNILRAPILIL